MYEVVAVHKAVPSILLIHVESWLVSVSLDGSARCDTVNLLGAISRTYFLTDVN